MKRYLVELRATYVIEAENVVQARHAAKAIRSIGERVGRRMITAHDRGVGYRVTRQSEKKSLTYVGRNEA